MPFYGGSLSVPLCVPSSVDWMVLLVSLVSVVSVILANFSFLGYQKKSWKRLNFLGKNIFVDFSESDRNDRNKNKRTAKA
jgi:amino acid transporter